MNKTMKLMMAAVVCTLATAADAVGIKGRYFTDDAGKAWIPVGCNICTVRTPFDGPVDHAAVRAQMDEWLRAFAANGGDYVRLWLGCRAFEIMPEKPGVYDPEAEKTLTGIVRLCEELGVKLKFTIESFRMCLPKEKAVTGYQKCFNRHLYAPYVKTMKEFYESDFCRRTYLGKVERLKALGFGDSPAVVCWELWNEINATAPLADYAAWSDYMLARFRKMFPKQLVVQNLGSFSDAGAYQQYDQIGEMPVNDFMQVHRYLDMGAPIDACRAPMDVIAATAVREMLARRTDKPAVLAETGAVIANHQGPSPYYPLDKDGALLHDALFAPFFAGGAGCGHFWHWDCYIAKNNLWHHFARFKRAVAGLDPIAEEFRPFYTETHHLRVYGLKGRKTTVIWCRDKQSDWRWEFVESKGPVLLKGEKLPFYGREAECYLPWEDKTVKTTLPVLPDFWRSIVVRLDTPKDYEPFQEAH